MDEEFTTFGTNRIMVDNIAYQQAETLAGQMEQIPGVKSVGFDDTEGHYKAGAALFSITYDGDAEASVSINALSDIRDLLDGYDVYVTGATGNSSSDAIAAEMQVVTMRAAKGRLVLPQLDGFSPRADHLLLLHAAPPQLCPHGLRQRANRGFVKIRHTIPCFPFAVQKNNSARPLQLLQRPGAVVLCFQLTDWVRPNTAPQ